MPGSQTLLLPLTADPFSHHQGERTLHAAVALHRAALPAPHEATRTRLSEALPRGDTSAAEAALAALWRNVGLAGAHDALAACLAELSPGRHDDGTSLADHRRAVSTAASALELLRASTPAVRTLDPVVLTTPPEDRHTLALTALAHQLQAAGRGSLVVDDLPIEELRALVRTGHVPAVVISAHLPMSTAAVRRTVASIRSVSPQTAVVFGGPGVPLGVRGPDLVSDDSSELLALLGTSFGVLTSRERQVLTAVADGLTNNEIATSLGVSPATVKTHLDHVFAKTGTEHRAAAVARALRQGWIT